MQYEPDSEGKPRSIFLYTHWGADGLEKVLANALDSDAGRGRWRDGSYLARIIFDAVIGDQQGTETGFGIAPHVLDEEFPTIKVDLEAMTVNGVTYEDFIKDPSQFSLSAPNEEHDEKRAEEIAMFKVTA